MATLYDEIYSVIRGTGISSEASCLAAKRVAKLVEEKFTSTNKPMPKLPTLRKVKQVYRSQLCLESRWEHVAIEFVYDYMCRQLSA
jgi:hypothetical protein